VILTRKKLKTVVWFTILLAGLSTLPSFAQKKKKGDEDSPRGIKLREAEFYFTEGEKYFILEDYSKALIYYQRAIESNPDNGTIHYKIAEVLSKSNKADDLIKASASIENAIALDKTNKFFYLSAAAIYNSLGRFEKAAEVYESMMREIKGTEEYLYELAAVYQYGDRTAEAIKTYDRAEDVFGVSEVSSVQKLRLYLEAGKQKEGLAEGEKLMNAFPDEEKFVMAFAEILAQKGLREQGVAYLEKFIAANPASLNAKMLLAGFYRDTNQESKARPILLTLFDNPDLEMTSKLVIIGAYNTELNNDKTKGITDTDKQGFALQLFEKLRDSNPSDPSVHIVGGDLYLASGKIREAQKEYLLAAENGDVSFEVWENLLYLEIQLEQYDLVLQHSEKALELYPNQAMIHYFNGFAHLRKRHFEESVASLEQAKKLSQANAALVSEINGMLGEAYNGKKDYPRSDKAYEDALEYSPNNVTLLNNYSFYLAMRKENLERAEKMSATLVKTQPDNPIFLDTHAWVLYMRQKYREARKFMERAISTGKATASHFEHYGDILYQLGEIDSAVIQWEKARGLNAKSETLNKKIANRKIYE